jgi:hypothetical protein
MTTLFWQLLSAVALLCCGLANLWTYYQGGRSKRLNLNLALFIFCLAPACVSASIANFNDSAPVRFGALNHQVQRLKQELALRKIDPKVREENAQELQRVEHELANEKLAEPILPQVPWKIVTIVLFVLAAVVPAGAHLLQSSRQRRTAAGSGVPGQPSR